MYGTLVLATEAQRSATLRLLSTSSTPWATTFQENVEDLQVCRTHHEGQMVDPWHPRVQQPFVLDLQGLCRPVLG